MFLWHTDDPNGTVLLVGQWAPVHSFLLYKFDLWQQEARMTSLLYPQFVSFSSWQAALEVPCFEPGQKQSYLCSEQRKILVKDTKFPSTVPLLMVGIAFRQATYRAQASQCSSFPCQAKGGGVAAVRGREPAEGRGRARPGPGPSQPSAPSAPEAPRGRGPTSSV